MFNFLGRVTLSSWDEAWYAVISRNILQRGDLLNLWFNGRPFYDHPPFVFWLQALFIKLFGGSEIAVRLPSFLLGLLSLIFVFLICKELFGKVSGVFSALALTTSPWFLSRSMSGNLDVPLTCLFLAVFYFSLKISKSTSKRIDIKHILLFSVSLGLLFLTKSLVPFTILPVLIYLFWNKLDLRNILVIFLITSAIVLPWFAVNYFYNPDLVNRYLSIGYPGAGTKTNIWENVLLAKTYLHNGMGNWFWWGVLSMGFGFLFYRKRYIPIIIFVAVFLFPFAFSNKGHIWHLIPLHPFWMMSFFGIVELTNKNNKFVKFILMIVLFALISSTQIRRNWYEILSVKPYKSDIAILSEQASRYSYDLYLDDDSVPESVYYSRKERVDRIFTKGQLRGLIENDQKVLIITKQWRLEEENINPQNYKLLKTDRDKILISNDIYLFN